MATPTEARLQWLRRSGLIAPDAVAANEEIVPLDFTSLNGREVGAVHSRFAVRHSHGLFELAKWEAQVARLAWDIRQEEAKFRVLREGDFKAKWELDDAMMLDEDVNRLRKRLTEAEIKVHIVEGIVKGYEGLARAASREMSRRISEQTPRD